MSTTRGIARAGRWFACWMLGLLMGAWSSSAQSEPLLGTAIAPQPLAAALAEFAHQTGLQFIYVSQIAAGLTSKRANTGLAPTAALKQLLEGTGLNFQFLNARTVRIYVAAPTEPTAQSTEPPDVSMKRVQNRREQPSDALDEILVTGTRRDEHVSDVEDVQNIAASVSVIPGRSLKSLVGWSAHH